MEALTKIVLWVKREIIYGFRLGGDKQHANKTKSVIKFKKAVAVARKWEEDDEIRAQGEESMGEVWEEIGGMVIFNY